MAYLQIHTPGMNVVLTDRVVGIVAIWHLVLPASLESSVLGGTLRRVEVVAKAGRDHVAAITGPPGFGCAATLGGNRCGFLLAALLYEELQIVAVAEIQAQMDIVFAIAVQVGDHCPDGVLSDRVAGIRVQRALAICAVAGIQAAVMPFVSGADKQGSGGLPHQRGSPDRAAPGLR